MSFKDAVTIPLGALTAGLALFNQLGLPIEGDSKTAQAPILVWGGSSSVGRGALQLLKGAGYTHIITTASPRNAELVKSWGATKVIDYNASDVQQQIEQAAGGAGKLQLAFNTQGSPAASQVINDLLKLKGGKVVYVAGGPGATFPDGVEGFHSTSFTAVRCYHLIILSGFP